MREVAVVSFAQGDCIRDVGAVNEVELIMSVISDAIGQTGLESVQQIDYVCSGSCDYLQGSSFAFVNGMDALGAWPPIQESHVEMDAAWAFHEAWLKIQMGHADSALVYGFGKSSSGELPVVLSLQLDPYYLSPLWIDSISTAALQARVMLDAGMITERGMAEVVVRSRRNAMANPHAQLKGEYSAEQLLEEPFYLDPLRKHDCCPISDGASAMVICTVDKAKEWGKPYAVIRGIDHRIESQYLGNRDLSRSPSAAAAAAASGAHKEPIQVAEIYAPFSHQEILLTRELGLGSDTVVNPSGGVLAGNLMMASGLSRIGEVATRIMRGDFSRGLAHATSGHCLQQNMVVILEGA